MRQSFAVNDTVLASVDGASDVLRVGDVRKSRW